MTRGWTPRSSLGDLSEEEVVMHLDRNAKLDLRSTLACSATPPSPERIKCWVYRCYMKEGGCNRLVTEWELKKYGVCPRCGVSYVLGTKPRGSEYFKLILWEWSGRFLRIKYWRYWGPEGWGWHWRRDPVRSFIGNLFHKRSAEEQA